MTAHQIILPFLASAVLCAPSYAGPRKHVSRDYIGTYLNEGKTTVEVNMISADGHDGTEITLDPGRIDRAVIVAGQTKLYTPFGTVETKRLLSTHSTPTPESHPQFFDAHGRSFYFRIVGRSLTLVKRQDLTVAEKKRLQAFKRQLQRDGSYNSEYPVPE
jgi:hypothetical protein